MMKQLIVVLATLSVIASAQQRFGGLNDDNEFDWPGYLSSLGYKAGPGFALAILSLLAFPIFLTLRCCCNTLGGRKQSQGFCCPVSDDFPGYSKKEIWGNKIAVWAITLLLIIPVVIGIVGNSKVNEGITVTEDTLINTAQDLINKGNRIGTRLSELQYTQDIGATINDLSREMQGYLDQAEDVRVTADEYNGYRSGVMIAIFLIPLGLLILGSISGVINIGTIAFVAALICFIASFLIWIMFGLHMGVSTVIGDVCYEIDLLNEGGSAADSALDVLLNCKDGAAFQPIRDEAMSGINSAKDAACTAIDELCSKPGVYCPETSCNRTNIESYRETIITEPNCDSALPPNCNPQNITLAQCTTNCSDTDMRDLANEFITNFDLLLQYEEILINEIFPLLNCNFIYDTFDALQFAICETFQVGLKEIAVTTGVIGAMLVPGTVALIMGFKRFRKDSDIGDNGVEMY